ncbi:recombinase family protein [Bradyrhizobium nanningense]|nr:recombinase family protein [Bradyrhizobium nanningense]
MTLSFSRLFRHFSSEGSRAAAGKLRLKLGFRLRAGLYVRHSRGTPVEEFLRQLQTVKEYAEALGAVVTRVYVDTDTFRTPLSEIEAAARRADFDVLIVENTDRLTRKLGRLVLLTEFVHVHSVEGGDLSSARGACPLAFYSPSRAPYGRVPYFRVPYGYRRPSS